MLINYQENRVIVDAKVVTAARGMIGEISVGTWANKLPTGALNIRNEVALVRIGIKHQISRAVLMQRHTRIRLKNKHFIFIILIDNYVMKGDVCPADVVTGTGRRVGVVTVVTQWTGERLQKVKIKSER